MSTMESNFNDGSVAMQTYLISPIQMEDEQGMTTATVVQVGTLRPRPAIFVVDKNVTSNQLDYYECSAIFAAVLLFVCATPLSLICTCPLVYYIGEVRKGDGERERKREREREREREIKLAIHMQAQEAASRGDIERTKYAWKRYKTYAVFVVVWTTFITSMITIGITTIKFINIL